MTVGDARDFYYHAGVEYGGPAEVRWSERTHRSRREAEREARKLARQFGGRPIVEYWRRERGMRPQDADAVVGSYEVRDPVHVGAMGPF